VPRSETVNIRFPDELHEAATAAANAERRPLGSWIRNLVEDALAPPTASTSVTASAPEGSTWNPSKSEQSLATRLDGRPLLRDEVSPNFKKGGK
jgi:hypothetical protein